jgi:hypothetical protein
MPLITCEDCGHSISDQAASCIHCGRPQHADLSVRPAAGSDKATEKGVQRAKWNYDLGHAIGGLGFAIGFVAMIAGAPLGGGITIIVTGALGLWIAYFS